MEWNEEYQKYACKILVRSGYFPPMDHIGFAYLVFTECWASYDPLKSNPLTYYGYRLKASIQTEKRYGELVHIPVLQQDTTHSYLDLDMTMGDSETKLGDILAIGDADDSDAILAFLLDELTSMYPKATKVFKEAIIDFQHHLLNDTKLARKYRTQHTQIRQELYDRYKKWKYC